MGGCAFTNNKMPDASALIYKYDATLGKTDYTTIIGYAGQSKDVIIPDNVNGVQPKTIAASAFANSGLNSISMPDSITSIGSSAFYANNLKTVKLPANLVSIGSTAFRQNYLQSVEWPSTLTSIGSAAFVFNYSEWC